METQALLTAALSACGAAGNLSDLKLDASWTLTVGPWLAPLGRSLKTLAINSDSHAMTLAGSLGAQAHACMHACLLVPSFACAS